MSVILDALHKARGDKRNPQQGPAPETLARVVDASTAPDFANGSMQGHSPRQRPRGWMFPVAVIFGLLSVLVLVAAAFFLLFKQVRNLEQHTAVPPAPAAVTTARPDSPQVQNLVLPPVPVLPTPLPLSELPVQPPAASSAPGGLAVSVAPAGASAAVSQAQLPRPAAAAVAVPEFTLGSIVCENADCIASLNGRTVRVGDEIRQYRVIKISSKDVTLKSVTGNDLITLSMYK